MITDFGSLNTLHKSEKVLQRERKQQLTRNLFPNCKIIRKLILKMNNQGPTLVYLDFKSMLYYMRSIWANRF